MAIANELSGDVAVALMALAENEKLRDTTKVKEIVTSFYSALLPLTRASRKRNLGAHAAKAKGSGGQQPPESNR